MPVSNCATGKVRNPATGRCVNKNSPVLKKNVPIKQIETKPNEKILIKCGLDKFINPKTKKCIYLPPSMVRRYIIDGLN